jgi:UDP-N-acetylmuramoylalanine-D-glutamate ligase
MVNESQILRGAGPSSTSMVPSLVGPTGGFAKTTTTMLFHGAIQYHAFPNNQGGNINDYCEIFQSHGNYP